MVRAFAQALGIALVVFGSVGLAIGEQYVAGLVNAHLGADLLHLITGVILAWVAFARRPAGLVRQAVVGVGALYLVLALLGWFVPALFGLLPQAFTTADNLLHLAIGVLALVVVWLSWRQLMTPTLGG